MSVLRLYEDENLSLIVSTDGDFTNPDEETTLDGTHGDSAQKALWVAVEQTVLSSGIDGTQTTITLAEPRFADPDYPVIIVDSEKMLITAGHGTATLTVTRGYNNTSAASHSAGAVVRLAYDCSSNSIVCTDNQGTDESSWITYCDDDGQGNPDGNWESPHLIPNLNHNQSVKIWRRLVVPAGTAAGYKQDLVHRLACTVNETAMS